MSKYVIFIFLILSNGCVFLVEPDLHEVYNPKKTLDDTFGLIRENYPFISFKKINIDSLYANYSNEIFSYSGDEINRLIFEILSELKDGHVWFSTSSGYLLKPYTPRRTIKDRFSFGIPVVQSYLSGKLKSLANGKIMFGNVKGDIGYIYLKTFSRDESYWWNYFTGLINEMKTTKALIVDVRQNGGGSDVVSYFIFSHFIKEPFLSPIWLDAKGNEYPRIFIKPQTSVYKKPVVLLQNGVCFSAAEGFVSMMRELNNVTTIGDTTAGGSGNPKDFVISYGYNIHLSTMAQLTYQREYIEWNGISPDLLVKQSRADVEAGKDIQLEAAINFLNNNN